MTPFTAALLGLSINQGAYTSEVVRAGLISVDLGQYEAAKSIGMTRIHALRRIILPQAMRVIIPPIGNEFISMVKTTSLASMIQYSELLYNAQTIYFRKRPRDGAADSSPAFGIWRWSRCCPSAKTGLNAISGAALVAVIAKDLL